MYSNLEALNLIAMTVLEDKPETKFRIRHLPIEMDWAWDAWLHAIGCICSTHMGHSGPHVT